MAWHSQYESKSVGESMGAWAHVKDDSRLIFVHWREPAQQHRTKLMYKIEWFWPTTWVLYDVAV